MNYGVTKLNVRKMAHEVAVKSKTKFFNRWNETKLAGNDWLCGFMKRNSDLSLRKPEACNLSRATAFNFAGSVVKWLKHRTDNQHGLGSKLTCTILLCPWERHFTALSPAWWSWQAVLNYSNISTKLLADSNILVSPEASRGNCLPYV